MKKSPLFLLVTFLLFQSCATRVFHNKAFLSKPDLNNKTMAILPVNMVFTGAMPSNLSPEQQEKWENAESKMMQDLLVHYFRTKSARRTKAHVQLLPVETTNKLLAQQGIDQHKAWELDTESVKQLKADWILKVTVKKDRMMSELASIGVDVASNVIDNLLHGGNTTLQGNGMAKTYTIYLEAQLIDVATETVISTFIMQNDASWTNPPKRILQRTARRIVRKGAVSLNEESKVL